MRPEEAGGGRRMQKLDGIVNGRIYRWRRVQDCPRVLGCAVSPLGMAPANMFTGQHSGRDLGFRLRI